jgi:hypothetical protein
MNQLVPIASATLPALVAAAGERETSSPVLIGSLVRSPRLF